MDFEKNCPLSPTPLKVHRASFKLHSISNGIKPYKGAGQKMEKYEGVYWVTGPISLKPETYDAKTRLRIGQGKVCQKST